MSYLDEALGDLYGALGAPPLRLLSGLPSAKRGEARPGHLSVDVKLRKKRQPDTAKTGGNRLSPPNQADAGKAKAIPGLGIRARQPDTAKTGGNRLTQPSSADTGKSRPLPGGPAARGAGQRTGAQMQRASARGRTAVQRSSGALTRPTGRQGPALLSGPDDAPTGDLVIPFTANARVWVTNQLFPLRGLTKDGAPGPQVNWPDGTPAAGVFWLPQLDLSVVFDPRIPSSWYQGTDPLTRKRPDGSDLRQQRGAGWVKTPDADAFFGIHADAWEWRIDYGKGIDHNGFNTEWPEPPDVEPFLSRYFYTLTDHVDRSISDWTGHTARINRWATSFDWSRFPPSVQAPVWLWLNLLDPSIVSWTSQEAEIYRADLQPIDSAGEPTALPGPAWLCLDVLDAIQTGAHGMPILVKAAPDGSAQLDRSALTSFLDAHPDWRPLFDTGTNSAGMLAIVNDVGARVGGTVYAPPEQPTIDTPPATPLQPTGDTGAPLDPFTGEPIATPTGNYPYPTGGGYPYPTDGGYPYGAGYGGDFDLTWWTAEDLQQQELEQAELDQPAEDLVQVDEASEAPAEDLVQIDDPAERLEPSSSWGE